MLGFASFETAEKTICGIEAMHIIRKGQIEEIQSALAEVKFIKKIWEFQLNILVQVEGSLNFFRFRTRTINRTQ